MVQEKRGGIVKQLIREAGNLVLRMREDIHRSRKLFYEGFADQAPDRHISPRLRLERLEAARRPLEPPAEPVMLEDSRFKLPDDRPISLPQY